MTLREDSATVEAAGAHGHSVARSCSSQQSGVPPNLHPATLHYLPLCAVLSLLFKPPSPEPSRVCPLAAAELSLSSLPPLTRERRTRHPLCLVSPPVAAGFPITGVGVHRPVVEVPAKPSQVSSTCNLLLLFATCLCSVCAVPPTWRRSAVSGSSCAGKGNGNNIFRE